MNQFEETGQSEKKIKSMADFDTMVEKINANKHGELIFRGQSDSSWNIVSSAYRYLQQIYPSINMTETILGYFKSNVRKDIEELRSLNEEYKHLKTDDEVMCVLQHLGGKSTFVDFSTDPHIALYFACEQFHDYKDGIVFVMFHDNESIYNKAEEIVGGYKSVKLDDGNLAQKRISMQKSCFLDSSSCPIVINDESKIERIIVDKNSKKRILEELKYENIYRNTVYPDILAYINDQKLTKDTVSLKSVIFRETAQRIKDGCVRRMRDALETLVHLSELRGLTENDNRRIDFLKVGALMCECKYDEALIILETIHEPYIFFRRLNDENPNNEDKIDAIDMFFVPVFEKANCYMGKSEYEKAYTMYLEAAEVVDDIVKKDKSIFNLNFNENERDELNRDAFEKGLRKIVGDVYKGRAKCLVRQNKSNLYLALDILMQYAKNEEIDDNTLRVDRAALYMDALEWNKAIDMLQGLNEDYALNLLGNCYMELSKTGNKYLYLEKAVNTYDMALSKIPKSESEYMQKTSGHDHHYKKAMALKGCEKIEEAEKEYDVIIMKPYENEDAMHDVAYMLYQYSRDTVEVVRRYMYAICNSRAEKNPRNFNDLGRLLVELSYKNENFPQKIVETLYDGFKMYENAVTYPESVQIEIRAITDCLLSLKKGMHSIRLKLQNIAEKMFIIADLLNRKDAFANKNLGDIYFDKYQQCADDERVRHESAEKALRRYILAESYYLVDGKRCIEIKDRIQQLEEYLKREIVQVCE